MFHLHMSDVFLYVSNEERQAPVNIKILVFNLRFPNNLCTGFNATTTNRSSVIIPYL